ncbi:DUF2723 domain-containing protein [bacterium]|nr:DUF2723 domain-containing protein [candidate division CSSED10-310 bacterium]
MRFVYPFTLLLFLLYVVLACPGPYWGEGPLLTLCGRTLGISHPPGYPLHIVLDHAFQWLPFGDAAMRANLLSALFGALAAACIYFAGRRFGLSRWASLAATGALALHPLVARAATMAEVYTLNLLLTAACLLAAATGGRRGVAVTGFLAGLAIGNHLTIVLSFPVLILLLLPTFRERHRRPALPLLALTCFLAGAAILLYHPLRARSRAPVRWDQPDRMDRFLTLVTAADEAVPSLTRGETLSHNLTHLLLPLITIRGLGIAGTILALAGIVTGLRDSPLRWGALLLGCLCYLIPIGLYWTNESDFFALPLFILTFLFAGRGLDAAADAIRRTGRGRLPRLLLPLPAIALLAPILARPPVSRADCHLPRDMGRTVLATASKQGLIISERSDMCFMLWYLQRIEGMNSEVAVFFKHLFSFAWAAGQLRDTYPHVRFPLADDTRFEDSHIWNDTFTSAVIEMNRSRKPLLMEWDLVTSLHLAPVTPRGICLMAGDDQPAEAPDLSAWRFEGADELALAVAAERLYGAAAALQAGGWNAAAGRLMRDVQRLRREAGL